MEALEKQKAELRAGLRAKMRAVPAGEKALWDHELCERALALPEIRTSECVYGYMSLRSEAGTRELLERLLRAGKRVALPRVEGQEMGFFYIRGFDELEKGAFGIMEPAADCPPAKEKDALMLVPGTAFTRDGGRLGKGGGFYDRFLLKEPDHRTVGLAYGLQVVEELPMAEHDRRVALVVTPDGIFDCGSGICRGRGLRQQAGV